jgi:hypothetical protein
VNAFTRALAALATITLLSVDDIEAPRKADMDRPNNISAVDWAPYNQRANRTLAELSGLPAPEPGVLELAPYEVRVESPLGELLTAVRRAASELEGTSEKGDRVSLQLLTALARFHAETGTL